MRPKTGIVLLGLLVPLGLGLAGAQEGPPPQGESNARLWSLTETRKGGKEVRVDEGSETEAKKYYGQIAPLIGVPGLLDSRIDQMLGHFGYRLTAQAVEQLAPEKPAPAGVAVVRFFAPKIIDVSQFRDPNQKFGWRQVVRFKAQTGSAAAKARLDSFYLLFNFASKESHFPGGHAGQIQAMITPLPKATRGPDHRDAYFLVYNRLDDPDPSQRGKIGFFLSASFDFGVGASPGRKDRYYVPTACGQCHGVDPYSPEPQKNAKVNYLDTDHWFDRREPGDDFPEVSAADVLVKTPFGSFRTLNQEIEAQNQDVDPQSFALKAVRKWLQLHKTSDAHVPAIGRGFGSEIWSENNENDKKLLPLLNQYCFRCHSSIKYHVFDKAAVRANAGLMIDYIDPDDGDPVMPQDRRLNCRKIARLRQLLEKLQQEDPARGR